MFPFFPCMHYGGQNKTYHQFLDTNMVQLLEVDFSASCSSFQPTFLHTAANTANSVHLRLVFITSSSISLIGCYYLKFSTQPDVSLTTLPHFCSTHVSRFRAVDTDPLAFTGGHLISHHCYFSALTSSQGFQEFKKL